MAVSDPVQLLKSGFGSVTADPTVFSSSTLTTTAVKATIIEPGAGLLIKVKIANLSAATNRLAWVLVARGAAAPTPSAIPGTGTVGTVLGPLQTEYITLAANTFDLYIIGSALSTIVCVSSFSVGV